MATASANEAVGIKYLMDLKSALLKFHPRLRALIEWRYIERKAWEDIHQLTGYSSRWLLELMQKALVAVYDLFLNRG